MFVGNGVGVDVGCRAKQDVKEVDREEEGSEIV
jgi:hypothetical protein